MYYFSCLKANKIYKELADKLRENSYTSIRPIFEVINDVLKENGVNNAEITEYKEIIDLFKELTQNAFGASEFTKMLLEFNKATLLDVEQRCQELNEIAEINYKNASIEYEKCKNTVFFVYPGIAAMISLLII